MTVGDILDQAFTIYRQAFVTLTGIVAIIHVPILIVQIISGLLFGGQLVNFFPTRAGAPPPIFTPAQATTLITFGAITFALGVLTAVASIFQTAALSIVVSERFLGHTITIRQAYGRALQRWTSLLGIILILGALNVVIFAGVVVPFFFIFFLGALGGSGGGGNSVGGALFALLTCVLCVIIPAIFIAFYAINIRLMFAAQTIVLENLGSVDGLRRSWNLVRGSFWRVLGISIALGVLVIIIAGVPTYVFNIGFSLLPWHEVALALNTATQSIISILILPIQFAAYTLLYYDLRIRKEGFDLQLLAQQLNPPADAAAGAA